MTMNRSRIHVAVCGGAVALAIGFAVLIVARGEAHGDRGIQPGTLAPAELRDAVTRDRSRGIHVILFSTDCAWCARQVAALEAAGPARIPIHVVVLRRSDADTAVPALPPWVTSSSISRAQLERRIGRIATPTHVLLDDGGRVVSTARGFKPADILRRMDTTEASR